MSERLRLYDPVRPLYINQNFGDNIPCVKDFGLPTQSIVSGADNKTCPPGYDKLYGKWGMEGHNGTDLMAGEQNVYAACDGVVIEKQTVPARGLGVGIITNTPVLLDRFGEHYIKIRYWHFKSFNVEVGDSVKVGDLLGTSDNTGYSAGNHLHWEGQPMDKDAGGHPYLAFPGGIGVIASAIDIAPFRVGIYADTVPEQITLLQQAVRALIAYLQQYKK